MNSKYSKYVTAIIFGAAAIVAQVSHHYLSFFIGYFQLGRTLGANVDVYQLGLACLLGAITFIILIKNSKAMAFMSDAVHELLNVSWPNQKEIKLGTIVVIVTVVLAGLALGVLDLGLTWVIRQALGA